MEEHKSHRAGWLRAAVLGANDGIVSTASLVIGVAAATTSRTAVITAGVAGLVGGAMSMAAGLARLMSLRAWAVYPESISRISPAPRAWTASKPR